MVRKRKEERSPITSGKREEERTDIKRSNFMSIQVSCVYAKEIGIHVGETSLFCIL